MFRICITRQGMLIIQSTGTTVHLITKIRDHRSFVYCDYAGPLSDINHLPAELNRPINIKQLKLCTGCSRNRSPKFKSISYSLNMRKNHMSTSVETPLLPLKKLFIYNKVYFYLISHIKWIDVQHVQQFLKYFKFC